VKIKQEIKLENFAVKALNILSKEGKRPTKNVVSIDKNIGLPVDKNNILNIKEKTNIFISIFAMTESNIPILI
jgi:hypothetical protein